MGRYRISVVDCLEDPDMIMAGEQSKDPPLEQRRFANSRGWRFRIASHGGGEYLCEQSISAELGNTPGLVCYGEVTFKLAS